MSNYYGSDRMKNKIVDSKNHRAYQKIRCILTHIIDASAVLDLQTHASSTRRYRAAKTM